MKKRFIYFISLLMIGLAACTEDFNKEVAPPQTNDPEESKDAVFQLGLGSDLSSPILLGELEEGAAINVVTVSSTPSGLSSDAMVSYKLRIAKTEDMADYEEIACEANGSNVTVKVADLDELIKKMFGKAPNANQVYFKTLAYITQGKETVLGTTNVVGPATITPISMLIEEGYYLIGDLNGWSQDALVPFKHSGKDVYDDPIFSVVTKISANCYFKIVPESAVGADNFWDVLLGSSVDGDTSFEGSLITSGAQALKIEEEGYYRLTLNMSEYTYTIERTVAIESAYYLIGDMNGWSPDNLTALKHSGKDPYEDPIFSVAVEVGANCYFKIVPESARSAENFWDNVYGTAVDGDPSPQGNIVTSNAQAIKIEEAGFYKISLNMLEYTYSIEKLESNPYLYIPGNHQGWNPGTAPVLASPASDLVYTGFAYLDGEFKFTSHPDWDHTNYGDLGDGKLGDGGNLNADPGFYYLEVDLNTMMYKTTLTNWGLIGDATAGGWDNSTDMVFDRDANLWRVTAELVGGASFKFRANNGWDINVGGDTANLTFGGDNIPVAESGTYDITLSLTIPGEYSCTIAKK